MRLFGFEVSRVKTIVPTPTVPGGWWNNWFGSITEPFSGAWQRNIEIRLENVLTFSAVYSCVTLIAGDIGKLRLRIVVQDEDGIWTEKEVPAFSPVLRKPNRYQTRQKFIENWITSKLIWGNTYVLKERDERNVVTKLYILDPQYTKVMVAPDGQIFYQLNTSYLHGVQTSELTPLGENRVSTVTVPASEIIHDVAAILYHPLCGVSPLTACGLAATQGLNIQNNSSRFFANNSKPGGILTAPGQINDEQFKRIKDYWEQNYTGNNVGKVAVLGDGLKYESLTVNAVDADLINQLKWTAETVCSVFHVPPWMIGIGPYPSYNNLESLTQAYYQQCLQTLTESIEALLDEGLGLSEANQTYGTEFDLDDLLKMDTATQYRTYGEGVKNSILTINEARFKVGYGPKTGGDTPLSQQQNYSIEALAKRDAKEDPFAKSNGTMPKAKPSPEIAASQPQKLLPDYFSKQLSEDEMYQVMGSAL